MTHIFEDTICVYTSYNSSVAVIGIQAQSSRVVDEDFMNGFLDCGSPCEG